MPFRGHLGGTSSLQRRGLKAHYLQHYFLFLFVFLLILLFSGEVQAQSWVPELPALPCSLQMGACSILIRNSLSSGISSIPISQRNRSYWLYKHCGWEPFVTDDQEAQTEVEAVGRW